MVYLFLSHEFNQRIILSYLINENEVIPSLTIFFLQQTGWKEKFLICMEYLLKIIQIKKNINRLWF